MQPIREKEAKNEGKELSTILSKRDKICRPIWKVKISRKEKNNEVTNRGAREGGNKQCIILNKESYV